MKDIKITDSILYVGVDDKDLDLFESQYVVPNGVSYNSYVILDEKIALMDTVDQRATEEWLGNLDKVLGDKAIDYLVVSHMEPDHAANVKTLIDRFPSMQIVGNAKTFTMLSQFFNVDLTGKTVVVKEGDTLNLGTHTLQFVMAPMVHWPEVMVTYEQSEKVLFSADGFGKFGALDAEESWAKMLEEKGAEKVVVADLSRGDMAEAVEDAFRYSKLVVAAASYDAGVFPCMEEFLHHLKAKNYQKRTVGMIENGSWAPSAAKQMRAILEEMKNITICEPVVTIKSTLNETSRKELEVLAEVLAH